MSNKAIIDRLRTKIELAWWDAAASILKEAGGDHERANLKIVSLRGYGIDWIEAEHLMDHVETLVKESK